MIAASPPRRRWLGCGRTDTAASWSAASAGAGFDAEAAAAHRTRRGGTVHLHRVDDPEGGEVRLHCRSEERAAKERGIAERFAKRFEEGLQALHEGLSRPRAHRRIDHIRQRIGRLKEKSRGAGQHYDIEVVADGSGEKAVAVTWAGKPADGSMATHPGVHCLRSNETGWSDGRLWRTYATLTDLEAVFRSLKSELGLRSIHHREPLRAEGHLFITVIACQLMQVIRKRLAERGARSCRTASWTTLRRTPACHRDVQVRRRPDPARAQGDAAGAAAAGDPRCAGHRIIGRRHEEDDRLRAGKTGFGAIVVPYADFFFNVTC